ncbi:hypothetical protein [Pseudomonas nitroreducens]|uniref:hypothetical protein n=1 Tax=Pseudomonas nitroreducens TaxID=46680 RepID=UPI001131B08B|nr:hypothetical protein [Pseudomonas nitroreducens]
MTEWILAMWINTTNKAPDITASGYASSEACLMAGDLFKAADMAAKKQEARYSITCQEVEKDAQE